MIDRDRTHDLRSAHYGECGKLRIPGGAGPDRFTHKTRQLASAGPEAGDKVEVEFCDGTEVGQMVQTLVGTTRGHDGPSASTRTLDLMLRWLLIVAGLVCVAVCVGLAGLVSPSAAPSTSSPVHSGSRPAVRLRVFRFVDRRRAARFRTGASGPRRLVTSVRYPSTGREPFPLVVFGHGFALVPSDYTRLLDSWTRAGYVVAAPVFPVENADAPGGPDEADLVNQPGDISFVIGRLLRLDRNPRSRLYGLIDRGRIAVAGHSDGGDTAFAVAYERNYLDRRVRLALILSGAPLPPESVVSRRVSPPLLVTQGTNDPINLPSVSRELFIDAAKPKFLLSLIGAEHLAPYSSNRRQLAIIEQVTIAFLNHYFKHAPLRDIVTAGNVPRRAHLVSRP